jgi:HAD superfamily hydrolase (TIGR01484 family)
MHDYIEVFVTDLDHTLLHPETEDLPDGIAPMLKEWMESGNAWVIATGRRREHLEDVLDELDILPDYYITRSRYIHGGRSDTVDKLDEWNSRIERLTKKQENYADNWIPRVLDWADENEVEVEAMDGYVMFGTAEGGEKGFHFVSDILDDDFKVLRNREFLIAVPAETGKGNCLEYLSDVLGWQESEIFCVGDGMNDANMLDGDYDFAKAAVANAEPQLKDLVLQHGGIILEHVGGHAIESLLGKLLETHVRN